MLCKPVKTDFLWDFPKSLTILFSALQFFAFSQEKKLDKLPSILNEVSGIEVINDSTIIAVNDSGNEPLLHVLSIEGKYKKAIKISNAKNVDWEDITYDTSNHVLYIADLGNNLNHRKDLCIYKVALVDLNLDSIPATKIPITFPNQGAFPPNKQEKRFDCEAITYYNGALYIATKCADNPYTGTFYLYRYSFNTMQSSLCYTGSLGTGGWLKHSITAMDNNDSTFYFSTYSRVYSFNLMSDNTLSYLDSHKYKRITQKESLSFYKNHLYLADEKSPFFVGRNIYKLKLPNDKTK